MKHLTGRLSGPGPFSATVPRAPERQDGPLAGGPASFDTRAGERREGDAVLIRPEQRRPFPEGGVRVLMVGCEPAQLMLEGFVMGNLANIRWVETASDPAEAIRSITEEPDRYDLVLVVHRNPGLDALAFARALADRAGEAGRLPFLVFLAGRFGTPESGFEEGGPFAARLMKPLRHEACSRVIDELFLRQGDRSLP